MPQIFANNAFSTLATSLAAGVTGANVLDVASGHGARFPAIVAPDYSILTIDDGTNVEIVKVTGRATDEFTIPTGGRGLEGTTDRSWTAGAGVKVQLRITRDFLNQLGIISEKWWIRANATRNLTSNTSEQKIFGDPTNGRITLPVGTYRFEGIIYFTGMSATSGNAAIDILGAGTAVCEGWMWHTVGIDATAPTTSAAQTGSFTITQQSVASVVLAATGTAMGLRIRGTLEVTTAGTLIPSITLVTASAATLAIGSYLTFERYGSPNIVSYGPWD